MRYTKKKNDGGKGFTLIEMLVVTGTMAVISMACYFTFSNGVKIWQKAKKGTALEDINIFFDRFAADLRNTFRLTGINFSGKEGAIEFATLVSDSQGFSESVGRSEYFYDAEARTVLREQRDFSQIYTQTGRPQQVLLKEITAFAFSYYFFDKDTKMYEWRSEWLRAGMPLAVRIRLSLATEDGPETFVKTVTIPVKR